MCHTRQARHHHAQGHPASPPYPWREGLSHCTQFFITNYKTGFFKATISADGLYLADNAVALAVPCLSRSGARGVPKPFESRHGVCYVEADRTRQALKKGSVTSNTSR